MDMKRCLIIINNAAGKSKKISFDKVEKRLGADYAYTRFLIPDDGDYCLDGYDAVAVCGGDGTLGNLLAKAYARRMEIYYFPAGTLNDRAKSKRYDNVREGRRAKSGAYDRGRPVVVGTFDEIADAQKPVCDNFENRLDSEAAQAFPAFPVRRVFPNETRPQNVFSYVLAAGSFTPIGYTANAGLKKKLGSLAYIFQILKQYKIHRMAATIRCGGKTYDGDFTLIMALKSPRCFGFRFNKAFDPESASGHLIAIRSPKHGGFAGLVEMFFPFFRVFFLGLKKEREGRIIFKRIYSCDISHKTAQTYCRDGEKYEAPAGDLHIGFARSLCDFNVIDKF